MPDAVAVSCALARRRMQRERSVLRERCPKKAVERLGCRGRSLLLEAVNYTDAGLWFRVPIAHMLREGVGKAVWGLILKPVSQGSARPPWVPSNKDKAELRARSAHVRITGDFGRPHR